MNSDHVSKSKLFSAFLSLSDEGKDLHTVTEVDVIDVPESPIEFYRTYVQHNKPVIIDGGVNYWPAFKKWSNAYLREKAGDHTVTIDATPTGHGDTIVNGTHFVKPDEQQMKFNKFLDYIEGKHDPKAVLYLQHQNSNLKTEFSVLEEDIDEHIPWVSEAMGSLPDVVNIWIGNDDAVSSLHKDPYENFYIVVSGEKHFTLLPPTDFVYLYEQKYKSATYKQKEDGSFVINDDEGVGDVPWIPVDPDDPDMEKYPLFKHATPIHCTVLPGQMLYLPSLWFHKVSQSADEEGRCIAINYWYDMQYGLNWIYFRFMENMIKKMQLEPSKELTAEFDEDEI